MGYRLSWSNHLQVQLEGPRETKVDQVDAGKRLVDFRVLGGLKQKADTRIVRDRPGVYCQWCLFSLTVTLAGDGLAIL